VEKSKESLSIMDNEGLEKYLDNLLWYTEHSKTVMNDSIKIYEESDWNIKESVIVEADFIKANDLLEKGDFYDLFKQANKSQQLLLIKKYKELFQSFLGDININNIEKMSEFVQESTAPLYYSKGSEFILEHKDLFDISKEQVSMLSYSMLLLDKANKEVAYPLVIESLNNKTLHPSRVFQTLNDASADFIEDFADYLNNNAKNIKGLDKIKNIDKDLMLLVNDTVKKSFHKKQKRQLTQ
jgi:hypothetical protein